MASHSPDLTMALAMGELRGVTNFNEYYRTNFLPLSVSQILGPHVSATMMEILGLGSSLNSFLTRWVDSRNTGSDAITGELDARLLENGTLDLELLGKIMRRLKNLDISLIAISRSYDYVLDFDNKCSQSGHRGPSESIANVRGIFGNVMEHLEGERDSLASLIERCNMYYQSQTIGHLDKDLLELRKDIGLLDSTTKEVGAISQTMRETLHSDIQKLDSSTRQLDQDVKQLGTTSEEIRSSSINIERLTIALILMTVWLVVLSLVSFAFDAERSFPLPPSLWQYVLIVIVVGLFAVAGFSFYAIFNPKKIISH